MISDPPAGDPPATEVTGQMTVYQMIGQSEAQGPAVGTKLAPDGRQWRVVLNGQASQVYMHGGLVNTNGQAIDVVGGRKPGYNTSYQSTGFVPAVPNGPVPVGYAAALAMQGETPAGPGFFTFIGNQGESVLFLDDDPATQASSYSTGTPIWDGAVFMLDELVRVHGYGNFKMPTIGWFHGASDKSMPRGQYRQIAGPVIQDYIDLHVSKLGLTTPPRLFLIQPVTSAVGPNPAEMAFDQVDIVRDMNGVLVAPSYGVPWLQSTDHPSIIAVIMHGGLYAWAAESPDDWSMLSPPAVTRSLDQIEIPISMRADEDLIHDVGRWSAYGGDPAFAGWVAHGGGSITSLTVQRDRVILGLSGTVSRVTYAHFNLDTAPHTVVADANDVIVPISRGNLRSNQTRAFSLRGIDVTLERWLPRLEVLVQ